MLLAENYLEKNRLGGLDFLRTVAISFVFLFHYPGWNAPEWYYKIVDFGWSGVDLFFVLSRYLIASQLFKAIAVNGHFSLKQFYIRRAFRIIPVYLVVLALYFCIPLFREREALPPLWRFLTFTQNIGLNPGEYGTFSHAWSLCIEEQFYLIFPLVLTLIIFFKQEKRGFYILILLFVMTCLLRVFIWYKYMEPLVKSDGAYGNFWITWIYYPTHTRLDGLLSGISLACIFHFMPVVKDKIARYGNLLLLIGLGVLAGAYFLCQIRVSFNANIYGYPLIAIGYAFIVASALVPSGLLSKIKWKIFSVTAAISYSLYLTHKAIRHLTQIFFKKHGVDVQSGYMLLLCILFCCLTAFILYQVAERPFLKWRNKILLK